MSIRSKILTLIASLLIVTGCIPSLHPLYTDKDVVFKKALLGVWSEPGSSETWAFTRSEDEDNAYRLVYTEGDGKSGAFLVHLVNLDGNLFLDLYPERPDLDTNDFYAIHLMPVHTFMHVPQIEPDLRLAMLDFDWLGEKLERHPKSIRHEMLDDTVVFTASTRELQAFHLKHLATEDAYDVPRKGLVRVEPKAASRGSGRG